MAFERLKEHIIEIESDSERVLESNVRYYKLWLFKVLTNSMSEFTKVFVFGTIAFLVLLFIAIGGAFAIGSYLQNNALGFLIVGGILLVLLIIIFLLRKKIIEKPILSKMSEIYFKE